MRTIFGDGCLNSVAPLLASGEAFPKSLAYPNILKTAHTRRTAVTQRPCLPVLTALLNLAVQPLKRIHGYHQLNPHPL